MLKISKESMIELDTEQVPIIEAGDPLIVTKDDDDVMVSKTPEDELKNNTTRVLFDEDVEGSFASDAQQYAKENPQVFEGMWQRLYLERQARLLEGQISLQNEQQRRLTETLQQVAQAMQYTAGAVISNSNKNSTASGRAGAASSGGPSNYNPYSCNSQMLTSAPAGYNGAVETDLTSLGPGANDPQKGHFHRQELIMNAFNNSQVHEEVKVELENSKRELAEQVANSKEELGHLMSKIAGANGGGANSEPKNLATLDAAVSSAGRTGGEHLQGSRHGRGASASSRPSSGIKQGKYASSSSRPGSSHGSHGRGHSAASANKPSLIPAPKSGLSKESQKIVQKQMADGSSQFRKEVSDKQREKNQNSSQHAGMNKGGLDTTTASASDSKKPFLENTVFESLASRLFPSSKESTTREQDRHGDENYRNNNLNTTNLFDTDHAETKDEERGQRDEGTGTAAGQNVFSFYSAKSSKASVMSYESTASGGRDKDPTNFTAGVGMTSDKSASTATASANPERLTFYQNLKSEIGKLNTKECLTWTSSSSASSAGNKNGGVGSGSGTATQGASGAMKKRTKTSTSAAGTTSTSPDLLERVEDRRMRYELNREKILGAQKEQIGGSSSSTSRREQRGGGHQSRAVTTGVDLPNFAETNFQHSVQNDPEIVQRNYNKTVLKSSSSHGVGSANTNSNSRTTPRGGGNVGGVGTTSNSTNVVMSTTKPAHLKQETRTEIIRREDMANIGGGKIAPAAPARQTAGKLQSSSNNNSSTARRNNMATRIRDKLHPNLVPPNTDNPNIQPAPVTKPKPFSFDRKEPDEYDNDDLLLNTTEGELICEEAKEETMLAQLVEEREKIENEKREMELEKLRLEAKKAQEALQEVLNANKKGRSNNNLKFGKSNKKTAKNDFASKLLSKEEQVKKIEQARRRMQELEEVFSSGKVKQAAYASTAAINSSFNSSPRHEMLNKGYNNTNKRPRSPLTTVLQSLNKNQNFLDDQENYDIAGFASAASSSPPEKLNEEQNKTRNNYYYFSSPPQSAKSDSKSVASITAWSPPTSAAHIGGQQHAAAKGSARSSRVSGTSFTPASPSGFLPQQEKMQQSSVATEYSTPEELLLQFKEQEYNNFASKLKKKYNIADADVGETREMLRAATQYSETKSRSFSPGGRGGPLFRGQQQAQLAGDAGAARAVGTSSSSASPSRQYAGRGPGVARNLNNDARRSPDVAPPRGRDSAQDSVQTDFYGGYFYGMDSAAEAGAVASPNFALPQQQQPQQHAPVLPFVQKFVDRNGATGGYYQDSRPTTTSAAGSAPPVISNTSHGVYVTELKLLECLNHENKSTTPMNSKRKGIMTKAPQPAEIWNEIDAVAKQEQGIKAQTAQQSPEEKDGQTRSLSAAEQRDLFREVLQQVLTEETFRTDSIGDLPSSIIKSSNKPGNVSVAQESGSASMEVEGAAPAPVQLGGGEISDAPAAAVASGGTSTETRTVSEKQQQAEVTLPPPPFFSSTTRDHLLATQQDKSEDPPPPPYRDVLMTQYHETLEQQKNYELKIDSVIEKLERDFSNKTTDLKVTMKEELTAVVLNLRKELKETLTSELKKQTEFLESKQELKQRDKRDSEAKTRRFAELLLYGDKELQAKQNPQSFVFDHYKARYGILNSNSFFPARAAFDAEDEMSVSASTSHAADVDQNNENKNDTARPVESEAASKVGFHPPSQKPPVTARPEDDDEGGLKTNRQNNQSLGEVLLSTVAEEDEDKSVMQKLKQEERRVLESCALSEGEVLLSDGEM
ncbi:unnamed protein product [Amoebophrya sp. A120]|nr:unnamed protein product [Amoebophrya sp. A120]|eukprot:GSA120T00010177001.1